VALIGNRAEFRSKNPAHVRPCTDTLRYKALGFLINELERDDWDIGGHTDWLRAYTSALDTIGSELKAPK
jgi:hypothetical protein